MAQCSPSPEYAAAFDHSNFMFDNQQSNKNIIITIRKIQKRTRKTIDGLTKRGARCKKNKGGPRFSVIKQSNL